MFSNSLVPYISLFSTVFCQNLTGKTKLGEELLYLSIFNNVFQSTTTSPIPYKQMTVSLNGSFHSLPPTPHSGLEPANVTNMLQEEMNF